MRLERGEGVISELRGGAFSGDVHPQPIRIIVGNLDVAVTSGISAGHDDFRDAVFGKELAVTRPARKQPFNAAIGKGPLDGKRLGQLHFNLIAGGEVKAAVNGLFAVGPGMEEGQDRAS